MSQLSALQRALSAEHAAVYVYGVIGGLVSDGHQATLARQIDASYTAHVNHRDRLSEMIQSLGGTPAASAPAYQVPNTGTSTSALQAIARGVESKMLDTYGEIVASSTGKTRTWAIGVLQQTALHEVEYGGRPTDFPGFSS